ncbi:MAG: hypothetical protein JW801_12080 [Bacteroidales bacterium]|nr:hypothetical protein [Bacteroidales bacterium]
MKILGLLYIMLLIPGMESGCSSMPEPAAVVTPNTATQSQGLVYKISDALDLNGYIDSKENGGRWVQRVFPRFRNYLNGEIQGEKAWQWTTGPESTSFLSGSDFHAGRFEGRDIIHPFHSFW